MQKSVSLSGIPIFAHEGAVIPLAPVVQYTAALPGGPLQVQVYRGSDASFDLVEDDGETTDYESGKARTTKFIWNDKAKELPWTVEGSTTSPQAFTHLFASLFDSGKDSPMLSEVKRLDAKG